MTVKYNFAAADHLSQQLSQLIAKLEWLIWLRKRQRSALLGAHTSDNWKGGKREQFERDFPREQARLQSLADEARRVQSTVADQAAAAHALQKAEQKAKQKTGN
jgi:hypothetical protein